MPKTRHERARSELDRMAALVEGQPTKAAKIRRLGSAGYKRQAIADFLGISYQHVRNVLKQPSVVSATYAIPSARRTRGVADSGAAQYEPPSTEFDAAIGIARFVIDGQGRITLSPELIAALGTRKGGLITARLENGELIVMGLEAVLRFVRRGIPKWKPGQTRWSDELIAERRAEAAREEAEYRRWRKERS